MGRMRVSLVARFVSHPTIDFGAGRRAKQRPRLGLERARTVYHRPRAAALPTIRALRSQTSRFRFGAVGHATRVPARRTALPFGVPRARRS